MGHKDLAMVIIHCHSADRNINVNTTIDIDSSKQTFGKFLRAVVQFSQQESERVCRLGSTDVFLKT